VKTDLAEPALHPQAQAAGVLAALIPERILQLGLGFWASKTLLSAVEHSPTSHSAPCRRGLRHKSRGYMAPDGRERRPSFLRL